MNSKHWNSLKFVIFRKKYWYELLPLTFSDGALSMNLDTFPLNFSDGPPLSMLMIRNENGHYS